MIKLVTVVLVTIPVWKKKKKKDKKDFSILFKYKKWTQRLLG